MRILHVIENLNTGGAEYMLINLATEQVKRQHQVDVLCLFQPGDMAGNLTAIGVKVNACHKGVGLDAAVIKRMLTLVRDFRPDVIHSHSLMGNYYMALVKLLVAQRSRLIVTRHGLLREGHVGRLGLLFHLSLWLTRWAVGVCDEVTDELLTKHARFQQRIRTIKNGINLQRFTPRNKHFHQQLTAQLQCPEHTRLVGIVARLNPIKNHALLLDAFALAHSIIPQSALVIIGDGPVRQMLEEQIHKLGIADAVFLFGDRTDIPDLLAGLDLFVLSSDNEGYSLALLEAAAAALPLVATDVGGNGAIVEHEHNGLLVPPKDPARLADALTQLLSNAELAETMGQQARAWVENNGSVQAMVDAYEQLYTVA